MKRRIACKALIAYPVEPIWVARPGLWSALATYDDPMYCPSFQPAAKINLSKQWFAGQKIGCGQDILPGRASAYPPIAGSRQSFLSTRYPAIRCPTGSVSEPSGGRFVSRSQSRNGVCSISVHKRCRHCSKPFFHSNTSAMEAQNTRARQPLCLAASFQRCGCRQ